MDTLYCWNMAPYLLHQQPVLGLEKCRQHFYGTGEKSMTAGRLLKAESIVFYSQFLEGGYSWRHICCHGSCFYGPWVQLLWFTYNAGKLNSTAQAARRSGTETHTHVVTVLLLRTDDKHITRISSEKGRREGAPALWWCLMQLSALRAWIKLTSLLRWQPSMLANCYGLKDKGEAVRLFKQTNRSFGSFGSCIGWLP